MILLIWILLALLSSTLKIQSATQHDEGQVHPVNLMNFASSDWVLGDNSIEKQYLLNRKTMQAGPYSICPIQTPFVNLNGECCICPPTTPTFSLRFMKCINCPEIDQLNRICRIVVPEQFTDPIIPELSNYNKAKSRILLPGSVNFSDLNTANKEGYKVCEEAQPFFNGISCISCPNLMVFDLMKKVCVNCLSTQHFNPDTNHCENYTYLVNFFSDNWENSTNVPDIQKNVQDNIQNPQFKVCPLEKPFPINNSCSACAGDTHFNFVTNKCVDCPLQMKLNVNQHQCSPIQFLTNPISTQNLIRGNQTWSQLINKYNSQKASSSVFKDCPSNTPYAAQGKCINCPILPYFNLANQQCEGCPMNTRYDEQSGNCLDSNGYVILVDEKTQQKTILENNLDGLPERKTNYAAVVAGG